MKNASGIPGGLPDQWKEWADTEDFLSRYQRIVPWIPDSAVKHWYSKSVSFPAELCLLWTGNPAMQGNSRIPQSPVGFSVYPYHIKHFPAGIFHGNTGTLPFLPAPENAISRTGSAKRQAERPLPRRKDPEYGIVSGAGAAPSGIRRSPPEEPDSFRRKGSRTGSLSRRRKTSFPYRL